MYYTALSLYCTVLCGSSDPSVVVPVTTLILIAYIDGALKTSL